MFFDTNPPAHFAKLPGRRLTLVITIIFPYFNEHQNQPHTAMNSRTAAMHRRYLQYFMTLRKTLSTILIVIGFLIAILGKFTLLYGVPFFLIGVIINFTTDRTLKAKIIWLLLPILLWMPMMMGFWYLKNKAVSKGDTYIFPKDFHGQAIVAFGIKNGHDVTIENGRRIFQFDSSGILLTKADAPRGLSDQKFYFKDNSNLLTPIALYPYVYLPKTKVSSDSFTVQLFGWNELGSSKAKDYDYKFMNLMICSLAEVDTIDNGFKSWKMHDTIVARIR